MIVSSDSSFTKHIECLKLPNVIMKAHRYYFSDVLGLLSRFLDFINNDSSHLI